MPRENEKEEAPPISIVALVVMHGMLANNQNQISREDMVREAFYLGDLFITECKRRSESTT